MNEDYQVSGTNDSALFTLKIHRGDGMALLAMNWKQGKPTEDFVGFAIEYQEPGGKKFYALSNRLAFPGTSKAKDPSRFSTLKSPIQKFRWVHFPFNADRAGAFTYRVTPVFMNPQAKLTYGEPQVAAIELRRETYPGQLNVAYTRGFISSQAFVERYAAVAPISKLIPAKADKGLTFKATHPKTQEALAWMGFEARAAILDVLDQAIADARARVCVTAYDLNEPEVVSRLEKLGQRLRVILDDSKDHKTQGSAENQAEERLVKTAGAANVKRQHMGQLQHNKTIVVDGPSTQLVICGSTNFSWRAFYVQSNNAVVLQGAGAVQPFLQAFENYWNTGKPADFAGTASAVWNDLGLQGIDAKVAFSPHSNDNALLDSVAADIADGTTSSLFYSLAFLYQTPGPLKDALVKVTQDKGIFVYGISDQKVGGIKLQKPDGNLEPVHPAALTKGVPEPFKSEPTGGAGIRMHHKFLVVDFDKPSARVYLGSYNFSDTADLKNGENLLLVHDRRVAVSYMVAAVSIFDHYHFRLAQQASKNKKKKLELALPPQGAKDVPWWAEYYDNVQKVRDRELFA